MDKLYIPGDLVMTNGVPLGTTQSVIYRVISSDPTKTLKLDDGTVLKGVVHLGNPEGVKSEDKGYLSGNCYAWVKDIVPIPLTQDFFRKNGWQEGYGIYYYEDITVVYIDNYYWIVGLKEIADILHIKYVHQLQHLLFGLGLNSEMEVYV